MRVSELSGGEQARILIARLMLQDADILILDEPTNDLDIPSLEVLEESLVDFPGALILVTHDRFMLDRVSTEILSLDGSGSARFFADYAQWEAIQEQANASLPKKENAPSVKDAGRADARESAPAASPTLSPSRTGGLSYKEQKELSGMDAKIMAAEAEVQAQLTAMSTPPVASDHVRLRQVTDLLHAAQERVEGLYRRWEELEGRR